ncbi:hypothetical protein AB3X91_13490 [Paraburkholderia sp. BR14263]|uniref:hypothetical protein n=1 Tax=unclassified Paraburkholderia TaxID=2615204 RepID=UPI0034CDA630
MSDKIVMQVTINPLISPLLYERLSRCVSAHERTMLLKALAEAMLRRELLRQRSISDSALVSPVPASATTSSLPTNKVSVPESPEILRAGNAADIAPGLSADLGNQLAGYFDQGRTIDLPEQGQVWAHTR